MEKFLDEPRRNKKSFCGEKGHGRVLELEKSEKMRKVDPAVPPKVYDLATGEEFRNLRVVAPRYEKVDDDFEKKQAACYGLATPAMRREALDLQVRKQRCEALYKKQCGALRPKWEPVSQEAKTTPQQRQEQIRRIFDNDDNATSKSVSSYEPSRLLYREPKRVVPNPKRVQRLRDHDLQGRQYNILTHAAVDATSTNPYSASRREHLRMLHPSQQSLERGRNPQGSLA